MTYARLRSDRLPAWTLEARVLDSWVSRMRGLLGTGCDADPVLLTRCSSIHTVGMGYPIDLLFVGERGRVLKSCLGVTPGEVRSCAGATCAIERPSSKGRWPACGDSVWVSATSVDALGN